MTVINARHGARAATVINARQDERTATVIPGADPRHRALTATVIPGADPRRRALSAPGVLSFYPGAVPRPRSPSPRALRDGDPRRGPPSPRALRDGDSRRGPPSPRALRDGFSLFLSQRGSPSPCGVSTLFIPARFLGPVPRYRALSATVIPGADPRRRALSATGFLSFYPGAVPRSRSPLPCALRDGDSRRGFPSPRALRALSATGFHTRALSARLP